MFTVEQRSKVVVELGVWLDGHGHSACCDPEALLAFVEEGCKAARTGGSPWASPRLWTVCSSTPWTAMCGPFVSTVSGTRSPTSAATRTAPARGLRSRRSSTCSRLEPPA